MPEDSADGDACSARDFLGRCGGAVLVEYEVEAVRLADGLRAAASFAVVVRVRDGRILLWREYQDPAAMALVAAE